MNFYRTRAMAMKLVYFDLRGKAEVLRLMLHVAGQEFDDCPGGESTLFPCMLAVLCARVESVPLDLRRIARELGKLCLEPVNVHARRNCVL